MRRKGRWESGGRGADRVGFRGIKIGGIGEGKRSSGCKGKNEGRSKRRGNRVTIKKNCGVIP